MKFKSLFCVLVMVIMSKVSAHDSKGMAEVEEALASGLLGLAHEVEANVNTTQKISVLRVSLAAGYKEPTHTHPGEEVIYVVSGEGKVWQDGVAQVLSAGDIVHVKEGVEKSLENTMSEGKLELIAYLVVPQQGAPLDFVE